MNGRSPRLICAAIAFSLAACAAPREVTKTARGAIEQLLLAQALNRSLLNLTLPLAHDQPIHVEVSGLQLGYVAPLLPLSSAPGAGQSSTTTSPSEGYFAPAGDLGFIKDAVAAHLGVLGYRVLHQEEDASYLVRVVVQSFGTNQSTSFFGLPPIQSLIIPFALPQLTIYQSLAQDGYVRYGVEVIERATGRLYFVTPWHSHRTHHDQYTVLFFFTFRLTDLDEAP